MTTITSTPSATPSATPIASGFGSLGQKDFLAMLTAELKQQDPFSPVDQKDMLAQMAQFSSLAGVSESNTTLKDIAAKLDTLIAAQAASTAPVTTQTQGN